MFSSFFFFIGALFLLEFIAGLVMWVIFRVLNLTEVPKLATVKTGRTHGAETRQNRNQR